MLSVDYRLAPEHPFPAGLDDVMKVVTAALSPQGIPGVDPHAVVLAGDSADGNLTAAACLWLRDEAKPQPKMQMMFVPMTNLRDIDTSSMADLEKGFFLTREQIEWYRAQYIPNSQDLSNPYVSPMLAQDHLDLAPAYIAVAGFDPLNDDGTAYAQRLRQAGVPTVLKRHSGLVHPFANSTGVWAGARAALDEAVHVLKETLGVRTPTL